MKRYGYAVGCVVVAAMAAVGVSAQSGPAAAAGAAGKAYRAPRTPWGHPDLQGVWNNGTSTPLERPAELGEREFLTDEELQERSEEIATRAERRPDSKVADVELAYNNEWWDRGKPLKRTSLIIDPANGRLPTLTDEGKQRVAARQAARQARGPADSYTDRPLQERCITYHGVPPFPTGYNNNYQIAQNKEVVAIRYEMMAETRIIPIDGRPQVAAGVRQWIGSSRGHFEGETLVVETTNYRPDATFRFPAANDSLRIVERFTRTSPTTIDYQFTVHNPAVYTAPWTAILPMTAAEGPLFEYACHEGNYGMHGVLSGHRQQEKDEALKKGSR
ncbi:MAG: hypothetical protein AB7I13_06300 [Vicinamibacterales bacterium]